jgi:hypothetical protein
MTPNQLNHRIPTIIALPLTITRRMIHNPRLARIRALKKPIMPRAVVAIGAGEYAAWRLLPCGGGGWCGAAVPG